MPNPLIPNFNPEVGKLATNRYDFQKHIDGEDFKQNALSIDLFPTLIIDGYEKVNVHEALSALTAIVTPPVIQDATSGTKGIIQLSGDISGSASAVNIIVSGIQTVPVSAIIPSNGDVLTFQGSQWTPVASNNTFIASGDLTGDNTSQAVTSLTGDGLPGNASGNSNTIHARASTLSFASTYGISVNPTITQDTSNTHGDSLVFMAQSTTGGSTNGGNVIVTGGGRPGTGLKGGVKLKIMDSFVDVGNFTSSNLVELTEVAAGRRVLALLNSTNLNSSEMPSGTGDMVMYIKNTLSPPTTGTPSNGVILYSSLGNLRVKQSDGNDFSVGEIPNPSLWGDLTTGKTSTQRFVSQTTTGSTNTILTYPLPSQHSTRIDILAIGKQVGQPQSAQYNLSVGFVYDGTAATLGTLTISDQRFTTGGTPVTPSAWTPPNISLSGTNAIITTGAAAGTTINWMLVVQITTSQAG